MREKKWKKNSGRKEALVDRDEPEVLGNLLQNLSSGSWTEDGWYLYTENR
jgi:hypothetical protein